MKFFISTGYRNYYRYLFLLSFVPKTWKYGAFHKWPLCERCEKDQGFARTFTLPLSPFGTEKSQGVKIQTGENTRRWLLDYYCWWKLTGRLIHFIQTDKGGGTNRYKCSINRWKDSNPRKYIFGSRHNLFEEN